MGILCAVIFVLLFCNLFLFLFMLVHYTSCLAGFAPQGTTQCPYLWLQDGVNPVEKRTILCQEIPG